MGDKDIDELNIPVTGIGCLSAAGGTCTELMETIFSGQRKPVFSEKVRANHDVSYPMFELPAHAVPNGYYERPECFRCGLLAIAAAKEALADAGYSVDDLKDLRVGVCVGTTVGNAMNNEGFYHKYLLGEFPGIDSVKDYLKSNPAEMVAQEFSLNGPRQCIANACSSGAVAIGQGERWIRDGICDLVLAGGSDMLCRVIYNGFVSLKITDSNPCRPFDKNRQGLNLGEGAGMIILESPKCAAKRKTPKKAVFCGYGNCSDAYHISAPHPNGLGLQQAIDTALRQAKLTRNDISFINAHGTATQENDRMEGLLFSKLFPDTPFFSTKGYTGHTLGAAGAIEAIITILCLAQQRIPANIGFETPDPDFEIKPTTEIETFEGDYALSDSVAFGGNNAALIFGRV